MIDDLKKIITLIEREDFLKQVIKVKTATTIQYNSNSYPIYSFSIGNQTPTAPVLLITGGVHGLERIGAQLAWSLLKTTIDRIVWDHSLRNIFQKIRLVVIPLLNPSGYYNFMRSNGRGVDLMRNSPIDAIEKTPYLIGGQRFSHKLPWFRGTKGKFEAENQALVDVFNENVIGSNCALAIDFHSGFGMKDRIWFPYSHTNKPFENLAEIHALTHLFEQSHPYHIYQIEPQGHSYLIHGDMWDHLYFEYKTKNNSGIFLPVTLEMGSWNWVKKNPLQIFSKEGAFNPIKEHRIKRTYRRHHLLFDFLLRALYSNQMWSKLDDTLKNKHSVMGLQRWYT